MELQNKKLRRSVSPSADAGISKSDDAPAASAKVFTQNPEAAATDDDRKNWQGWCEILSDPAYFNQMIKDLGVKGPKFTEVWNLDELVTGKNKPLALLLLFPYRGDSDDDSDEGKTPANLWFANQTTENNCATMAIINLIMNASNIEIGEHLTQFKAFTSDFTPALRGDTLSRFEFARNIHNSFATKADMLNSDLIMKNKVDKAKRRAAQTSIAGQKRRRSSDDEDVGDPNHYIGFLPFEGKLFLLDGMNSQAHCMGPLKDDNEWLEIVREDIRKRENNHQRDHFTLFALVREPLEQLQADLDANVEKAKTAEGEELLELIGEQDELEGKIKEERTVAEEESRRVEERRADFQPFIRRWLEILADKGVLKDLVEAQESLDAA
ncbi:MAG: hypothetical protein M1820_008257 [Bogoriella megaspora]|nr:MAG: hypothetical protein M1820_008257 [Bogoriella megaspora]